MTEIFVLLRFWTQGHSQCFFLMKYQNIITTDQRAQHISWQDKFTSRVMVVKEEGRMLGRRKHSKSGGHFYSGVPS